MRDSNVCIPKGMKAVINGNCVSIVPDRGSTIMDRVKTFNDACNDLGDTHPLVIEYKTTTMLCMLSKKLLAYMKLCIVCAALNEGWEPEFEEREWLFYPLFCLRTKEEVEKEGYKNLVSAEKYGIKEYAGFGFVQTSSVYSTVGSPFGAHLCLRNATLAEYCGRQFIDLWAEYYLLKKKKKNGYKRY